MLSAAATPTSSTVDPACPACVRHCGGATAAARPRSVDTFLGRMVHNAFVALNPARYLTFTWNLTMNCTF
jgi:hypothetical protein